MPKPREVSSHSLQTENIKPQDLIFSKRKEKKKKPKCETVGKWGQAKRESTERWIETPLTIKSSVEFWAHHFNGTTYQAQECVQEEREREREREKQT